MTSAEPGDGKTTILANLAVCYAQAEKRTLLIDADLRRPGLTGLMDMRGPRGLSEVLRSEVDIAQMAPRCTSVPPASKGLDILPSGSRPTDPAELLGSPRFSQLLAWAETVYDLILIDSPPILATTDTAIIGRLVDGVILVVQPAKNRRRLVTRVVERLGTDEDSRAGAGRQSHRLGRRTRLLRLSQLRLWIRIRIRVRRESTATTSRGATAEESGEDSARLFADQMNSIRDCDEEETAGDWWSRDAWREQRMAGNAMNR